MSSYCWKTKISGEVLTLDFKSAFQGILNHVNIFTLIYREALTDWMNNILKKDEKDLSMSKFHRQEGNHFFSLKDYISCIKIYTLSINTCPPECSEEISLAYANRSAALFHIELYEDCIADIEMALKTSYPLKLYPKVLLRKAKCLQKLGEKECFQSTVEHLESAMKVLQIGEQSINSQHHKSLI